jgi:hypothetical protein
VFTQPWGSSVSLPIPGPHLRHNRSFFFPSRVIYVALSVVVSTEEVLPDLFIPTGLPMRFCECLKILGAWPCLIPYTGVGSLELRTREGEGNGLERSATR